MVEVNIWVQDNMEKAQGPSQTQKKHRSSHSVKAQKVPEI